MMKIDKAAKELLDSGKLDLYGDIFDLDSLEREDDGYKCSLVRKGIFYSHVKATSTKLTAIKAALEHLAMMGNQLY